MHGCKTQEETLIRNLQDAGCPQAIIEQFMEIRRANDAVSQIRILSKQRRGLLERIHNEQDKLDCLDHLLFQLNKERPSSP